MKIVQINHFINKAAGNIMLNIHASLLEEGIESFVAWGRGRKASNDAEFYINDQAGIYIHALYTRLTDKTGFLSKRATKRLIEWLNRINPDIIHLHCIHGYFVNFSMLFEFIKEKNIRVIWTQHDCWSFTGHCAYFDMVGCHKWKEGCHDCTQSSSYPKSWKDNSFYNWNEKRKLFSGLNATIVTPCQWLSLLIKQSFLGEYETKVIYNGIDTTLYKSTDALFRKKNKLNDQYVILGVASEWTERKGLKDFLELNEFIDHEQFQIVLVGLSRRQIKAIPSDIVAIERTENVDELVDIYSSADIFFNPTYEDNFPTTNLESIACGTPVLTYDTGGAGEAISSGNNGIIVGKGDMESVKKWIHEKPRFNGIKLDVKFNKETMVKEYKDLYYEKN